MGRADRGRERLPIPRGLAILSLYASLLVIVVGVALVFIPGALAEADGIVARLPATLDRVEAWATGVEPEVIGSTVASLTDAARAGLLRDVPPRAEEVVGVGLTVAEAAVTLVTVFALVYFWITERARLQRYATAFLPLERRAGARDAWNDIELRLGGWVRGQLLLMGSVVAATTTAYWLLGLPSALLLGLIAGLAELIPLVGPALGAIPALVVAAALRPDLMVPVLIVYLVIQLVEGNLLVPIVMRGSVGISPFVVVVSLLVGGAVGGLVGALVAIPLAAIVVVILERLQARDLPVTLDPTAGTEDEPGDAALNADDDAARASDPAHLPATGP
jgi:predicted PurR-regulated permease PerM